MKRHNQAVREAARAHEPALVLGDIDSARLRAVVEGHLFGRDRVAAERLEAELDRAVVVPQAQVPPGTVTMDARVVFEETETGRRREITLCYPREADPSCGRISILAPVASALLGLAIGDSIEWPMPEGRRATFRIASVHRLPEEATGLES
jgi:regulator of nucleoside diphosphate kinase